MKQKYNLELAILTESHSKLMKNKNVFLYRSLLCLSDINPHLGFTVYSNVHDFKTLLFIY